MAASAQQPADEAAPESAHAKRAVELFRQSAELYREGKFREAVDLLREAYRLKQEPVLLYNLGRACENMGAEGSACAIDAYSRYLAENPDAKNRGAIEQRIAILRAQREEPVSAARTPPAPASPAVRPAPAAAPRGPSIAPWLVAGAGVAGLVAGGVLGGIALAKHGAAEDEPRQIPSDEQQASAEGFATAANVAFVAGAALMVIGGVWVGIDLRAAGATKAEPARARFGGAASAGAVTVGARF